MNPKHVSKPLNTNPSSYSYSYSSENKSYSRDPSQTPTQYGIVSYEGVVQEAPVVDFDHQGRRRVRVKVLKNKSQIIPQNSLSERSSNKSDHASLNNTPSNISSIKDFQDQVNSVSSSNTSYSADAFSIEQYVRNAREVGNSRAQNQNKNINYPNSNSKSLTTSRQSSSYANSQTETNTSNEYTYQSYSYYTSASSSQAPTTSTSRGTRMRIKVRRNKDGTRTILERPYSPKTPDLSELSELSATDDPTVPSTVLESIAPRVGDPVGEDAPLETLNLNIRDALPMKRDPLSVNAVPSRDKRKEEEDPLSVDGAPVKIDSMSRFIRRDCDTATAESTIEGPSVEESGTFSSNVTVVSREMPGTWADAGDLEEVPTAPHLEIAVAADELSLHSLHTDPNRPPRYSEAIADLPPYTATSTATRDAYVPSAPRVLDRVAADPELIYPRNRRMHHLPAPAGGYVDDQISTTISYQDWQIQPHGNWIARGLAPGDTPFASSSNTERPSRASKRSKTSLPPPPADLDRRPLPPPHPEPYHVPQFQFYAPPIQPVLQQPSNAPSVYVPPPTKPIINDGFPHNPLDDIAAPHSTFSSGAGTTTTSQSMLVSANPTSADYVEATSTGSGTAYVEVPATATSTATATNGGRRPKRPTVQKKRPLYGESDSNDYEEDEEEERIIEEYSYSSTKRPRKQQVIEYDFEEEDEEEEEEEDIIEEYSSSTAGPKPVRKPRQIIEEYSDEEEEEDVQEVNVEYESEYED